MASSISTAFIRPRSTTKPRRDRHGGREDGSSPRNVEAMTSGNSQKAGPKYRSAPWPSPSAASHLGHRLRSPKVRGQLGLADPFHVHRQAGSRLLQVEHPVVTHLGGLGRRLGHRARFDGRASEAEGSCGLGQDWEGEVHAGLAASGGGLLDLGQLGAQWQRPIVYADLGGHHWGHLAHHQAALGVGLPYQSAAHPHRHPGLAGHVHHGEGFGRT
ncbi:hypothetical protein G6F57_017012 [Rhizopus arrhizus]|nr:hypothetical protein G6F57_017012 [Rhizopus arrhizus]